MDDAPSARSSHDHHGSASVTMATLSSAKRPSTGQSPSSVKPSLLCNHCRKPLQTTCFLCACDCIFCEECTYSHFEKSSSCPSCGDTLTEKDFTELVVADSTSSSAEMMKTSLQGLFTRKSSSTTLPFADLCYSVIRQIEASKVSTKFVLKQFLKDVSAHGRQSGSIVRSYEALKEQYTQLQQMNSTQRLQLEKASADLQNKLQSREVTIMELQKKIESQEKMLDQFRRIHHGMTAASQSPGNPRGLGSGRRPVSAPRPPDPPFKKISMQKEAREHARQQAYPASASVLGNHMRPSSSNAPMKRSHSFGHGSITPIQTMPRPFSGNSTGSVPGTPRIRDLSSKAGYVFTSSSGGPPGSGQHINKRRKPSSSGGMASIHRGMSPNTAFALNRGPHSGPQYLHH